MSAPVKDVSQLPGKMVLDEHDEPIGEIDAVYAIPGEPHPTWVAVEFRREEGEPKTVLIPLAQLQQEDGDPCVRYTTARVISRPDAESAGELSVADVSALRRYYSVGEAFSG
jgi:PRC-barrel domain